MRFENLSLVYPRANVEETEKAPTSLKKINVTFPGGSRIGVIGRTGAGKSTLMSTFFRLFKYTDENALLIDGVSLTSMSLKTLRSRICLLSQSAQVFRGTLRFNLDPFNSYSDAAIWEAIDKVGLRTRVEGLTGEGNGLESAVGEGGGRWSEGEKQLICLARALLRNSKVFLLDEPTANIDPRLDALLQQKLRELCEGTIITVAHRLRTVIDSDLIVVLSAGEILEKGTLAELMALPNGWLRESIEKDADLARDVAEMISTQH